MSNPYDFLNDEIPLPPYTKVEDNLLKGEGWSTKVSKNFQAALATDILNDKFFLRGVAEKALDNKATFLDLTHREKETVIRYFRNMILRYSCKATGTELFTCFHKNNSFDNCQEQFAEYSKCAVDNKERTIRKHNHACRKLCPLEYELYVDCYKENPVKECYLHNFNYIACGSFKLARKVVFMNVGKTM